MGYTSQCGRTLGLQDDEKEEMKPLIQEVSSILFECDPMCLDFGANSDEYDFVADTVVLFLKYKETVDDVIEAIISSIKCWFSSDLSDYKTNDKFISMSQRIWEAWNEYKYDRFFKNVECVRETQNKQKSRGLNDYNIFTSILKASDEVRLHSRFIHSLLNPEGSHYQGTLFLEKFIKAVGLEEFGLNLDQTHVRKEHEEIDLYITDGEKHIIIENKIWAEDQKDQITRYINTIVRDGNVDVASNEEDPAIVDEDYVRVIYLTVRDSKCVPEPDGHSLIEKGRYIVSCNDQLDEELTNYQARYHRITYEIEIMRWLNASQNEVKNLTNMNLAIEQYKEVIQKLYRRYKGKVMTLESYLFESEKPGVAEDKIRLALSIEGELIHIKARVISEFFTYLYSKPLCGQKAEYYFQTNKTSSDLDPKYIERWIQGERGLKNFGLRWMCDDDRYVAVYAGKSHIHIGVHCSDIDFQDSHELFGSFEPKDWKTYKFFGYDLGLHGLKKPEALMESRYQDVENVLTTLCEKLRGV